MEKDFQLREWRPGCWAGQHSKRHSACIRATKSAPRCVAQFRAVFDQNSNVLGASIEQM